LLDFDRVFRRWKNNTKNGQPIIRAGNIKRAAYFDGVEFDVRFRPLVKGSAEAEALPVTAEKETKMNIDKNDDTPKSEVLGSFTTKWRGKRYHFVILEESPKKVPKRVRRDNA
jgi:hypothetical protein